MRCRIAVCLLALSLVVLGAAHAQPARSGQEIETMVQGFESLYLELLGAEGVRPILQDHGDGLRSLEYPLSEPAREQLRAFAAKPVLILSIGQMISDPSSARTLIHSALARSFIEYNLWWVSLTTSTTDVTRDTTITRKGPGNNVSFREDVTYAASSIQVFWLPETQSTDREGVTQTFKGKIQNGGSAKNKAFYSDQ